MSNEELLELVKQHITAKIQSHMWLTLAVLTVGLINTLALVGIIVYLIARG